MENKNWHTVEDLFHAASALPSAERALYLARECAGDEVLRRDVESLLAAFDSQPEFLERPAVSLGMRVLSSLDVRETLVGKKIGPYRILRALGRGGMGEVYLGQDTRLGRKIALKFLSNKLMDDNWAKRQFRKEAQAIATLDHPCICTVYGIEEVGAHSFIVMQYVEGETLADLIRKCPPDIEQAVALSQQIVSAVSEAHAHGIIHRDIKPQNIMVCARSGVKVLDFGLAKIVQRKRGTNAPADDASQISQSSLVVGTLAYMSPEQLRAERLDFRSDIFSIGAVIYELISGAKPFSRPGDSDADVISGILTSGPSPLVHPSGKVPPELTRIVFRCLEKDKELRYQSASELLYDLGNFQRRAVSAVPRRRVVGLRSAVALLLLLLTAAAAFLYHRWNRPYTLAVLPAVNESADVGLDYLEDGLADSLITKLSRLPKLRLSPLTSVSGYRGPTIDIVRVGRDLDADAVLTAKIVRQGDSLTLQTSLVRVADGSKLWSGHYDIKSTTFLDLQEKVAEEVASNLELWVGEDDMKAIKERETNSDEASREYQRGRHFLRNRSKENIQKATEKFKAAIEFDPAYARAWAGLADCYVSLNTTAYGDMPTAEAMRRADAAAKQALEIDSMLPEAHTSLGVINLKYNWDWAEAERQFKQAINLNPKYAPAHYWYSNLLVITGRQAEAITEGEIAKNLDTFSTVARMNYCRVLYYGRQYDKASGCLIDILNEDPRNVNAQYVLGFVYHQQGLQDEAVEVFQKLPETYQALKQVALGYSYGRAGRREEALMALGQVDELSRHTYVPPQDLAVIYLGLGDKDQTFTWLEKAYAERFSSLIYLTADPAFDSIRSDPRFEDLARRLNLRRT